MERGSHYSGDQAGIFFRHRGQHLEMVARFQPLSDPSQTLPHLRITPNMDVNTVLPPHFNLTGQVEIQGYTADFRGNYSSVFRGLLNGKFVSAFHNDILVFPNRLFLQLGCGQDHPSDGPARSDEEGKQLLFGGVDEAPLKATAEGPA
jgi:hypothetical protein